MQNHQCATINVQNELPSYPGPETHCEPDSRDFSEFAREFESSKLEMNYNDTHEAKIRKLLRMQIARKSCKG